MAVQIQLRRDTSAAWTTNDPVLLAAEFGVETDTGKFKIGDGSTVWSSLPYAADTPSEVATAVSLAVSDLVDAAPGALDTLNELAAALNDDADFANTVASQLALKANSADLSAHTSSTTGVHGISDTSLLETQSGAQAKATAAQFAAETYADSLAVNYDPAGSAATAQAAAEGAAGADLAAHNAATTSVHGIADTSLLETTSGAQAKADAAQSAAELYANSLSPNYDPAGSAAAAQTAAEAYADQAEADAVTAAALDATTKANAAQVAAELYADSLAPNYDPAGSAAAAQAAAELYADTAVSNLVDTAPEALDTLNELAAALGDDPNFATTVSTQIGTKADATDLASHESATANVHGITDTSLLETQSGAQTKADAAQTAAEVYADSLASNYDPAGSSSTAQTAAQSYTDSVVGALTTDDIVEGANQYFTDARALSATSGAYDPAGSAAAAEASATSYADGLAANYDPVGSASAAQAAAEAYSDSALGTHSTTTANIHGIADTALLETQTGAQAKADAAQTAAESTAATDASTKANAAQSAAQSYTDATVAALTTDDVAEGITNQYFTDERAQDAAASMILGGSHTNVLVTYDDAAGTLSIEGASAYGTSSFETDFSGKTTDDLTEGVTNQYFTDARALNATTSAYDVKGAAAAAQSAAQSYADSTFIPDSDKGSANGVATLDGNSKVPSSQLPAIAITDTSVVASEAAMLALTAQTGDIAVRSDVNKSFILAGTDPTLLSDWQELLTPTDVVQSVDGRTGSVSLSDLYDAAGSAASAQTAAESTAAAALSTHNSDTTNVHGIADTSLLETQSGAQAKANAAQSAAESTAASALSSHSADTTAVHGIADTSALVVTTDARLSNTRTPTDNTVSTAKIVDGAVTNAKLGNDSVTSAKIADGTIVDADISGSAAIAQSKISGLTTALSGKVGSNGSITQVIKLTQAEYDAITPSATTLYVIVG